MKTINCHLLPFAGGSSMSYTGWRRLFSPGVTPRFVEFAGRGKRIKEPLNASIPAMIVDTANDIIQANRDNDFFIYGHSMGAMIAYETYYYLLEKGEKLPSHLFFSGLRPPDIPPRQLYNKEEINDEELINLATAYGGVPENFYQNEEIRNFFLPILRSDMYAVIRHTYTGHKEKLGCDITVMYSAEDLATASSDIMQWRQFAENEVVFHEFSGHHFFIYPEQKRLVNIINETAAKHLG
jgi:surfactin synthase thioesterase subunit